MDNETITCEEILNAIDEARREREEVYTTICLMDLLNQELAI